MDRNEMTQPTTGNPGKEAEDDWRTHMTIPVWPTYGRIVKVSRNKAYQSVRDGEVDSIKVGGSIRVLVRPLIRKLKIEEEKKDEKGSA
jgi:hypothetical protein